LGGASVLEGPPPRELAVEVEQCIGKRKNTTETATTHEPLPKTAGSTIAQGAAVRRQLAYPSAIVRRGTDYRPQAVLAWSAAVRRQLANLRASTPRYELETAGGTSMERRCPETAG
jgi:hypothetical protein